MAIDFFVHPEHPNTRYDNRISQSVYDEYLEELIEIAQSSSFPVLIKGRRNELFATLISKEHRFKSESREINNPLVYSVQDSGIVAYEEWDRFTKLLAQAYKQADNPNIRIHGAYFGQCTKDFAIQLFLYLKTGKYFNPWHDKDKDAAEPYILNGDFTKSNIRYGVVIDPPDKPAIIVPPSRNPIVRLISPLRRHGNINYQLKDSETYIYSLTHI